MRIGILTYYRSENFGANLQALSTYRYLSGAGHTPIMIQYASEEYSNQLENRRKTVPQVQAHLDFVERMFENQTALCHSSETLNCEIRKNGIQAIIMGSDALVQHHPLLSRIHRGNRKPIYIAKPIPERMFPNLFWGIGIDADVKLAYMSVSSQNSEYKYFSKSLRRRMSDAIRRYCFVSVRDKWTQQMFEAVNGNVYPLTPDPVFAFNQNVPDLLEEKKNILSKFSLPENYVLISLMNQSVSREKLSAIAAGFREHGLECVSLPMPTGRGFRHDFKYSIPEPLDPADWYNLIRHASAYVGSNMHPVIVSLANAVPCYSLDFWGAKNFWNRPKNNGSSKVQDILSRFGLESNHQFLHDLDTNTAEKIQNVVINFPSDAVREKASLMLGSYNEMMNEMMSKICELPTQI